MLPNITGQELRSWRENHNLSQGKLGLLLGEVSHSAINRWEKGQDIPGPALLLLNWLMYGRVPWPGPEVAVEDAAEQRNLWALKLSLEDWHKLEAMATTRGFGDTKEYIMAVLKEELAKELSDCPVTYVPRAELDQSTDTKAAES